MPALFRPLCAEAPDIEGPIPAAEEPSTGASSAPGTGFLIAEWRSPAGYPWDVGVVSQNWRDARWPGRRVAFVLVPRPFPKIDEEGILASFQAFLAGEGPPLAETQKVRDAAWLSSPVWTPHTEVPTDEEALWGHTQTLLASIDAVADEAAAPSQAAIGGGESLPDAERTTEEKEEEKHPGPRLIADLWRDAPWLFLVHDGLRALLASRLGLPSVLDPSDLVAAGVFATGHPGRTRAWPPARPASIKFGTRHPLPTDAMYDLLLARHPGKSALVIAFLDGNGQSPEHVNNEDLPKRVSERYGHLQRACCEPVLIPLPSEELPVPVLPGRLGADGALLLWIQAHAARWLWLLFGGQVERLWFLGIPAGGLVESCDPAAEGEEGLVYVSFKQFVLHRLTAQVIPLDRRGDMKLPAVGFALAVRGGTTATPAQRDGHL